MTADRPNRFAAVREKLAEIPADDLREIAETPVLPQTDQRLQRIRERGQHRVQ